MNINPSILLSKAINKLIKITDKVIPIGSIPSVYCFNQWLDSHKQIAENQENYTQTDYYNGSENDLINIFVELLNLSTGDNCYNKKYILKRVGFLANEGLHIVDLRNAEGLSFKVTEEEADKIILDLAKKTKKVSKSKTRKNLKEAYDLYEKNVKSSVGLKNTKKKPAKRIKRDNKGRFIKNK